MIEGQTILFDSNFMALRCMHSKVGKLRHNDKPTGTIFGFLSSIAESSMYNKTGDFVFIWDHRTNLRKDHFPDYKVKRRTKLKTQEDIDNLNDCFYQMDLLREEILPEMGFANNKQEPGYEGDDIFGNIVTNPKYAKEDFLMYASDKDLYMLLDYHVKMFNPAAGELMTRTKFIHKYEMQPKDWIRVKAIGGCTSDSVLGILPEGKKKRIGEKTAINYISGKLKETSEYVKGIESETGKAQEAFNTPLVDIPWPGLPEQKLYADSFDLDSFYRTCEKYGMKSLMDESEVKHQAIKDILTGEYQK